MNQPPKFSVGQNVVVSAWWYPDARKINCKVEAVEDSNDPNASWRKGKPHGYLVKPLNAPGAHCRFVREQVIE